MKKDKTIILVFLISILSVFLFLFKINQMPLNADEASNAYDAYSILKTGKDQYGNFLPLRFVSFGDYKLPLLTYLAIPWIKFLGLNELAIRLVNLPFVFLFPIIVYLLVNDFFQNKIIALISAFLVAFSPGIQLLAKQAHEGYLTAFFLTVSFYFFIKSIKSKSIIYYPLFIINFLLTLFGYHSSRLWIGFFLLSIIYFIYKKIFNLKHLILFLTTIFIFLITDFYYKPTRVTNLLFFNNQGFISKTKELQNEAKSRFFYNEIVVGLKEILNQYLIYFSPQFLVIEGDKNYRFGFPGISPITYVEYLFLFIGLYYLFKNKEKWRYLILAIFLFAPLSGSLTWAGQSITRTIFIFIPILIISAYGFYNFLRQKNYFFSLLISILYLIFLFYSWEFYFYHYPKRAIVIRSWQAGYKELTQYIKENYQNFDRFYITKKNGQPYIFLLFYLKYPPEKYQKIAKLSSPDEYGFGQINEFNKFYFELWPIKEKNKYVVVGYPDDFNLATEKNLKQIKIGTETIFLIKEV
ncbi:MAG: ArnT family glycosyltransferase, partial [Microgenomates group bacterium]